MLGEGCHIFDLLSWFLDEEPVEIYATGPLETDNIVVIKFRDESVATMVCGGKGGLTYPKELMEVFCNARTLVVDSFFELRFDGPGGNLIRTFPLSARSPVAPEEDSMTGFYRASFAARPPQDIVGPHAANDLPMPSVDKGHVKAMTSFGEAMVSGAPFPVGVVDGARATICALKAYDSISTGKPVGISRGDYGGDTGV